MYLLQQTPLAFTTRAEFVLSLTTPNLLRNEELVEEPRGSGGVYSSLLRKEEGLPETLPTLE